MTLHAFVDESFEGLYIVAAAVLPAGDVNAARAVIRGVLKRGQSRIHFRKETDARRAQILTALETLDFTARMYVTKMNRNARGACFERMIPDLTVVRVRRLVIERDASVERFDRRTLYQLTRLHAPDTEYALLRAQEDLLLCAPDAIAWCWHKGGRWRARVAEYTAEIAT